MSTKHLGRRVHDLLDNRLSKAETIDAMRHLSECVECSARWRELREAREALNSSGAGIDMRFTRQLLDREHMAKVAQGESAHRARAASGKGRSPAIAAAASCGLVAATVGAAYVAGAPEKLTLEFASGGAGSSQSVSFHDPDSMRSPDQLRAWVHPDWEASGIIPIEAKVMQNASGANVLVASMIAGTHHIVVTEQHGLLVDSQVSTLRLADVEGIDAYVVSEDPAQVVWQAGDVVISASCECAMDTVEGVAAAFPTDEEPGFIDRVANGMGEFADAMTGE